MSLNKTQNYDKYASIKGQYKAKKLGLIDGEDSKCCFLKDDGSKEIITRDIVASDLPQVAPVIGGTQTFMHKTTANVIQINTINTPYELIPTNTLVGSYETINTKTFNIGDYVEIKCSGYYGTRPNTNEILRGITISLKDGKLYNNNIDFWDGSGITACVWPQTIGNTGFWDLTVKLIKTGENLTINNGKILSKLRMWSPVATSVIASSTMQVEYDTQNFDFNTDMCSIDIKLKPGSNSEEVSPSFVIYNTETVGTTTTGIGKVQAEYI